MIKKKTEIWAILLVLLCTFVISIAQFLLKIGSKTLSFDLSLFSNTVLIAGAILYGLGAVMIIFSLKGGELSVLYPLIATSFIWVSIESMLFLGEKMIPSKWLGIVLIMVGISFIGRGANFKK